METGRYSRYTSINWRCRSLRLRSLADMHSQAVGQILQKVSFKVVSTHRNLCNPHLEDQARSMGKHYNWQYRHSINSVHVILGAQYKVLQLEPLSTPNKLTSMRCRRCQTRSYRKFWIGIRPRRIRSTMKVWRKPT